ncbi:MAG: hypothetical protein JWQ09_5160, partial [Segetibacter sp.]|nr:hypothetical protein [Segetibacter sp.]
SLSKVSYQTVFVTVVGEKSKFNIKFWKFADKFTISCFVVTKDTFCVGPSSTATFNFTDGSKFTLVSDKKQNCRGELDKDFKNDEIPDGFSQKKVASIDIKGIHSNKTFMTDEKTAALIQQSFNCIIQKKIKSPA